MSKIIGIDLGTTNSVVALMEGAKPKVIPSAEGGNLIPSIVAISKNGERLVGQIAKRQAITNPTNTVSSVKRLIGRRFEESEIEKTRTLVPYQIKKGKNDQTVVVMNDKEHTPQEISAFILQKIKADAESYLGEKITEAVITVPAYFNDSQRQATKDAGKVAGLEVKRILNEPTAAALAYGLDKKKEGKIAVYDLGGGTFDITILEIGDGVFEVKSTSGDTHLGGDDFDQAVMNWIMEEFKKSQGIDLAKDSMALQRIKEAAEKAKIELSTNMETDINLPFITADAAGPKHLELKLSRAKLEQLTGDLAEKTRKPCEQALQDAKLDKKDIDEVILVGGQTRMPLIQKTVQEIFGKEPHKGMNPDEVVALGAAIQAGVLGGEVKDLLLLDVTPLTLGIETLGGVMTPLIERNTTIPTSKTQIFSTAGDSQTSVEIHVLQGERSMSKDNRILGKFMLDGIPPAPRGVPQVEVTFDIDANGILNVSAKDKATNKEQKITIQSSSGLSDADIESMRKDAEKHEEEDKKQKEIIELKNQASSMIYTAEKTLKDLGDKAKPEDKRAVEDEIMKLKASAQGDDIEKLKTDLESLGQKLSDLGAHMYENAKNEESKESEESKDADQDSKEDKDKGKDS